MKHATRWLLYGLAGFIVLGTVGRMIDSTPSRGPAVPVLLMRDSNELRFTNDGDVNLYDCTVTIDGGFAAILRELPAKDRKGLMRAQFSGDIPLDEFYKRTLRSV